MISSFQTTLDVTTPSDFYITFIPHLIGLQKPDDERQFLSSYVIAVVMYVIRPVIYGHVGIPPNYSIAVAI